jgi:hypothetical protein
MQNGYIWPDFIILNAIIWELANYLKNLNKV